MDTFSKFSLPTYFHVVLYKQGITRLGICDVDGTGVQSVGPLYKWDFDVILPGVEADIKERRDGKTFDCKHFENYFTTT